MNISIFSSSNKGLNRSFQWWIVILLCCTILLFFFERPDSISINSPLETTSQADLLESFGNIPLYFEANAGQVDDQVHYMARGQGYSLYLTGDEAVLALRQPGGDTGEVVQMQLLGVNPKPVITGLEPLPGKVNYFIGNDPTQWRTNITTYAKVRYQDIYPGIDLVYYGNQRELEYDFIVYPGADPGQISLSFDGALELQLADEGSLLIQTPSGVIEQKHPIIYQEILGERHPVDGRYQIIGNQTIHFALGAYNTAYPLIIDPILVYATYLGGTASDAIFDLAVDSIGNVYVTGNTYSLDFPTTAGAWSTSMDGPEDIFIVKLDSSGSNLIYASYIGGSDQDFGFALDIDVAHNIYVTGSTRSLDFPATTGAYDLTKSSPSDAYLLKLDASGSNLEYATYLGGNNNEEGFSVKVNNLGQAYVAGNTQSSDYPTTPSAYDTTFNPTTCTYGSITDNCRELFVTKFNATGSSLDYSTFIGGSGDDRTYRATLDNNENVYVWGISNSVDFPATAGAFDTTFNGGVTDNIVVKLNPTGSSVVYATYLGGSSDESSSSVVGGIAVDASGSVYVTGMTTSSDFPTTVGAFDTTLGGTWDAYITKIDPSGSTLIYSTFIGGSGGENGNDIAVDSLGRVYITGNSGSGNFPFTSDAFQTSLLGCCTEAVVLVLNSNGAEVLYSSFLGGSGYETGGSIAIDGKNNVYFSGITRSSDFPATNGAFSEIYGGAPDDSFIAKVHLPCLVTTLDDSGLGSLREAINCANTTPGEDLIHFRVAGTITLTSPLPDLSDLTGGTVIDGPSATGYSGSPAIVLSGPGFGAGLRITSPNNEIYGLQINSFDTGIEISGGSATNNIIAGNFIGNNGIDAIPNTSGILISNAPDNLIGGTTVEARNLISGNDLNGISIEGSDASGTLILGNYIGTVITGTDTLGNGLDGIYIENAPGNLIGGATAAARNLISGNGGAGISIVGAGATDNTVQGNFIGTDVTSTTNLDNSTGIYIADASNNLIGGLFPEVANVISGNGEGVLLTGSDTTGNLVQGNFIGSDDTGTISVGNSIAGVVIDGVGGNTIGGITPGARNLISGNDIGIKLGSEIPNTILGNFIGTDVSGTAALGNNFGVIMDGASNFILGGTNIGEGNLISGNNQSGVVIVEGTNNQIQGNYIGTDVTGTAPLGNGEHGVLIVFNSYQNIVGGTTSDAGNLIAFNGEDGVFIHPTGGVAAGSGPITVTQNAILSNLILSNGGLGIDLAPDAVTSNDPGDSDTGANDLQNFPIITSAVSDAASTTIQGTLNSTANFTFTLQFFANSTCDPSGFGEGEKFIGTDTVTTNGSGDASFTLTFATPTLINEWVTATATDSSGSTSEFSACNIAVISSNQPPTAVDDQYTTPEDILLNIPAGLPLTTIEPTLPSDLQLSTGTPRPESAPVAFDGSRYLVVFTQDTDIVGQFVDTSGAASGSLFTIGSGSGLQIQSVLAFNGNHYFVVYFDDIVDDLLGQVVDTSGNLVGSPLLIKDGGSLSNPSIASDGSSFLVVWQDGRNFGTNGYDIYGQLVNVNGSGTASLNSIDFLLSAPAAENQFSPAVAFGITDYLVTWTNDVAVNAGLFDVRGALVSPAGSVGTAFDISTATGLQGQRPAGIAFDGSNFLVVFDDNRAGSVDVYGARVSAAGVLLDGPATTGGIEISADPGFGAPHRPQVAHWDNSWLVVWGGTQIEGARVSASGLVLDNPDVDLFVTADSQWDPSIAIDGTNALVTWRNNSNTKFAQLVNEVTLSPGGVLSNDSDPDGDTLSGVLDTSTPNGTLNLNNDGSFDYTPNPDFCGTVSFTYHANDGLADSNMATVSIDITCVNDAPTADNDSYTGTENLTLTVPAPGVLDGDTDVDGGTLSAVLDTTTSKGTLSLNSDGSFDYLPEVDFCGSDSFTYHAHDGNADSNIATVTITVECVNDAPVAIDDSNNTDEDTAVGIDPLANDSDPDGDSLTITSLTQPGQGTVTTDGVTIVYTPTLNFNGPDSFTYTAGDSNGGFDTATVTVTVTPVNDPPVAFDDTASTDEDVAVTIPVLNNDSEVDGDALVVSSVTQPGSGTVAINPDGTVTYTPEPDFNSEDSPDGTDSFSYSVSDGHGGSATATVVVVVNPINDAPDAVDDTASAQEDSVIVIAVLANDSDVDDDMLTIESLTQPTNGLAMLNPDETVTYTPNANFNGSDSFTYTVSDGNGGTSTAMVVVPVNPVNDAPVAIEDSGTTNEDVAIMLDILFNDSDMDGDSLTVESVTQPNNGTVVINTDNTVTYTPDANMHGLDSFIYTVADGHGGFDTAVVTIQAVSVNDNPIANDDTAGTPEDTAAILEVLGNDSDVDGDLLSISMVTTPTHGALAINPDNSITYTPSPNYNGLDTFAYTIEDGNGGSDTAQVTVIVSPVNDPPTALDDTASLDEDTSAVVEVLANDGDVDGDSLTVSSVTTPTHGLATLNPDGTISYAPDADYYGPDTFNYTLSDGQGGTDTGLVNVLVTPVNDAPVAVDDAVSTDEDTAMTIDILANDVDVDGDTLSITVVTTPTSGTITNNGTDVTYTPDNSFSGTDSFLYTVSDGNGGTDTGAVTITVSSLNDNPVASDDTANTQEDTPATIDVLSNDTDEDGDTLVITNVTQPAHGTVTNNSGDVTFSPDANYFGADSFSYTVGDGNGGSDTATVSVTITPVNDAPVAQDDAVTTNEDTPATFEVLANDSDVEGDSLTISDNTTPGQGSITLSPDGTFTYTPSPDFFGTDSFSYTISDGHGGNDSAVITLTILPVDDQPLAVDDSATTVEDTPITLDVLANDSDVDGDPLTVSSVTTPTHGTIVVNPDLTISYQSEANYHGSDSFMYTLDDGNGGGTDSATVQITITSVNDVPVAQDNTVTTDEDTPITINILVNDTDVDGDPLAVTAVTTPTNGLVSINADNSLTYTPTLNFNGSDIFVYTITDGQGGNATATVHITVLPINDAPEAVNDTAVTTEDMAVTIFVLDNDSDIEGDALNVVTVTQPVNGTVLVTDNTIAYTPDANYNGVNNFTYTISDGFGGLDTAEVTVAINPVNDGPKAIDDTVTTSEDVPATVNVLANDLDVDGDMLSITTVTTPTHGSILINPDNSVTYVPDANYHGSDSFAYSISDGHNEMDTATVFVTVTPVNDAPVALDDAVVTEEDTLVTIAVLSNDSDVDGDTLTVEAVTQPNHGTAAINPDGSITFTPVIGFSGEDSFTYTVSDGQGGEEMAIVSVTVTDVNHNPVAIDDDATTNEDIGIILSVLDNDTDSDGDALTITSVTQPANGEALLNAEGTITYTPDPNYNGPDSFTYTISDNQGGSDTATVTLTVSPVNDIPVAVDDVATTDAGSPVTVNVLANDSDIEGDTLVLDSVTPPGYGMVTINSDNTVTYTPDAGFDGEDSFTYTVSDGNGGLATATVTMDVLPVAAACNLYPIALHADTLIGVEVGDILNDVLNGTQPGNFGWLTWTGNNGVPTLVASLTPPGNSFSYTNPNNPSDHVVTVGDWIQGKPGVSNAKNIRNALDELMNWDIVVPVWSVTQGNGANTIYQVSGFATIRLLNYDLPGQDQITAQFLGYASCIGD